MIYITMNYNETCTELSCERAGEQNAQFLTKICTLVEIVSTLGAQPILGPSPNSQTSALDDAPRQMHFLDNQGDKPQKYGLRYSHSKRGVCQRRSRNQDQPNC